MCCFLHEVVENKNWSTKLSFFLPSFLPSSSFLSFACFHFVLRRHTRSSSHRFSCLISPFWIIFECNGRQSDRQKNFVDQWWMELFDKNLIPGCIRDLGCWYRWWQEPLNACSESNWCIEKPYAYMSAITLLLGAALALSDDSKTVSWIMVGNNQVFLLQFSE